jgi:hypothetical protein
MTAAESAKRVFLLHGMTLSSGETLSSAIIKPLDIGQRRANV